MEKKTTEKKTTEKKTTEKTLEKSHGENHSVAARPQ